SEFGARPAQLREWTQTLPATFELVPPDAATVELVDDPSLRAAVETMLKPNALIAIEPGGRHPQGYARVDLPGGTPGIPLAYAIFFRGAGDHEKRFSSITFDAGANRPNSAGGLPGEALPERVDLIFRPDP